VLNQYRARFDDDPSCTNLHNWACFEADNPKAFYRDVPVLESELEGPSFPRSHYVAGAGRDDTEAAISRAAIVLGRGMTCHLPQRRASVIFHPFPDGSRKVASTVP